jgi:hypothetical protein
LTFQSGREADHSPPSSAEVKEWVEIPPLPQCAFMAWCSVGRAQGQLYFLHHIHTNTGEKTWTVPECGKFPNNHH